MSVKEIEAAILDLPADDLPQLMARLVEHTAQVWDEEIESDLECGNLDSIVVEVDHECTTGMAAPF